MATTRPQLGVQLPEVERFVSWPECAAMARAGDGREERGPWDAWTLLAGVVAA